MSIYDKMLNFRVANISDIESIMSFIGKYWQENHILAVDKDFFKWMYGNDQYGDNQFVNFFLMETKENELAGVHGFVPYGPVGSDRCVSSALTKVNPAIKIPLCGVELMKRFYEVVPATAYYSSGTNPKTMIPIGEKIFHHATGIMQQYYMLNPDCEDFRIAKIDKIQHIAPSHFNKKLIKSGVDDELVRRFDFLASYPRQGRKSKEYVYKRFFGHPIYKYDCFAIVSENGKCDAIVFGRTVRENGSKVFRIVDIYGNLETFYQSGKAWEDFICFHNYEYVDIVASRLPEDKMNNAGFVLCRENDENIIPNYFEPFIQKNITSWFMSTNPDIVIFKADGDQDRPNNRIVAI